MQPDRIIEVKSLDKYEFQIKTEQMEKLLRKGDYETAAKIADSVDWRKVRNVGLLTEVGEIYEKAERYEDSYEILNIAYDCAPIGRMIVYKMVEVAVKLQDFDEAIDLYKEFIKIAPHDLGRYVLKYEIYKGRGSSIEDQIAILEEYKSREYQEQWAYELAELYYKEGMLSKCVEECDDLILWFSEGEYVMKAMELKMRIQPLTASQEEKYRQIAADTKAQEIEVKPVNVDRFSTTNLQAALAESLQDFMKEESAGELSPETADISVQPESQEETVYPKETVHLEGSWQELKEEKAEEKKSGVWRDTMQIPKFLGENESGQLTFDMQENVLDRQITGQLSIEDIMQDWEAKKRETEAAIAEAAKRDEERRKEREHLRATGQLPDLNTEVKTTVPEEVLRLIEEIEGRLPIKIHVEPVERTPKASSVRAEESRIETSGAAEKKEPQEILSILEEPAVEEKKGPQEILDILEPERAVQTKEEIKKAEPEKTAAKKAVSVKAEPEQKKQEQDKPKQNEPEQKKQVSDETGPSPMLENLERSLEETISTIPPGQLSEEQKKLFAYFTSVRGMNKQLAELLEEDRMRRERREDSLQGNIVITGERGTGKTTLAADIVKALQKQRRVKGAKMAKIPAEGLNGKSVSAVIAKLGGGALLIERAGSLQTETAVQLSHAMTRKTGGLLVILEDEKEEIRKLFIRCESLGAKFTRTIEIPVFTNKELVAFGESYAEEKECVFDEMAVLALYNRIGNNQTSDHLVNVAEVKDMVDEAIDRGGKKGIFGKTKKSRMDEFGHLILLEKDFEK